MPYWGIWIVSGAAFTAGIAVGFSYGWRLYQSIMASRIDCLRPVKRSLLLTLLQEAKDLNSQ